MLRWIALALLLANLLVWAHGRSWLAPLGLAPAPQHDNARWAQQIRPDLVRVLPPSAAPAPAPAPPTPAPAPAAPEPAASAPAPLACLESEPLPGALLDAAEQALAVALPERGWIRASRETPAQYAVVVGPLARDALARKKEELVRLRVGTEEARLPGDAGTGLVLGRYDSPSAAQAGLEAFAQRNVRTARVLRLREAQTEQRLRIENLKPDKAEALRALKAAALGPNGLVACAVAAR
jgi:hypothetical protein